MLLLPGKLLAGQRSRIPGRRSTRRQQAPARVLSATHSVNRSNGKYLTLNFCRREAHDAGRQAPQAVGRHADAVSWDAFALGEALHVPPPAARALAASLSASEELPRDITIDELQKRCGVLQRELDLDPVQVARMAALQPTLLACPTAILRGRAQQLASLLSTRGAVPSAPVQSNGATLRRTPSPPSAAFSSTAHGGLERPARPASAAAGSAAPVTTTPYSASPTNNGNRGPHGKGAGDAAAPSHAVTQQAALALIARQPALLRVPLDRLVTRCVELADILGATPHDACLSLTRMRPEELVRMLQAPEAVIMESWLGLATAVAALEQPGLYEPLIPVTHAAQDYVGSEPSAPGGPSPNGVVAGAKSDLPGRQRRRSAKGRRVPTAGVFPPGAETAARRAALLCPQLLMVPPGWVRASALHLRVALGLSPPDLRRLLARSPRLLLLSRRHREEALRALVEHLALRGPEHAARLVAQQPNLLKWTPEGLHAKLEEMTAALGLSRGGVSKLCRNQPALLAMSSGSLAAKLRGLQGALRLPDADAARRLILRQPGLLAMSSATLERKVRLLAHGLGLTNAFVSAATLAAEVEPTAAAAAEVAETAKAAPRTEAGDAVAAPGGRPERGAVLRAVLRLVVAEPTLLTMSVETMPQRLEQLAEALGGATMREVRAAVLACPRLLLVQRAALRHRLRELAFGLDAPAASVGRLVLARPAAFFMPLSELRAAVERLEAAGAGAGFRGRRRVAVVLEALARERADGAKQSHGAGGERLEDVPQGGSGGEDL